MHGGGVGVEAWGEGGRGGGWKFCRFGVMTGARLSPWRWLWYYFINFNPSPLPRRSGSVGVDGPRINRWPWRCGVCCAFVEYMRPFLLADAWGGGWALMINVYLISIIRLPFAHSPPLHPALCLVQFLVLQAKHSSSFSRNPSRQGPSWLARHFCNNYTSALDLVLALVLVALVLGVIYRGLIVLRLFNWSFDFWFACY